MLFRRAIAAILIAAFPLPALCAPHVIAELGTAPLLGSVASTGALQSDVASNERLFAEAGTHLGLSSQEYAQVRERIARGDLTYVVIPTHLDAMSWSSRGKVHVVRDVVIPAHTYGWETDLRESDQTVAVFIPNKCGNLSVIRKRLPIVAAAPIRHHMVLASAPAAPMIPVSDAAPAPAPTPMPQVAAAPPLEGVAEKIAPVAAPVHHFAWAFLAIPLLGLIGFHGGSGGGSNIVRPGGPVLPPASCPTPAPHK